MTKNLNLTLIFIHQTSENNMINLLSGVNNFAKFRNSISSKGVKRYWVAIICTKISSLIFFFTTWPNREHLLSMNSVATLKQRDHKTIFGLQIDQTNDRCTTTYPLFFKGGGGINTADLIQQYSTRNLGHLRQAIRILRFYNVLALP